MRLVYQPPRTRLLDLIAAFIIGSVMGAAASLAAVEYVARHLIR